MEAFMRKNAVAVALVALVPLLSAACHHEPKPDHKGVFVVVGEKVIELKAVDAQTDFTPEGFPFFYLTSEPSMSLENGKFYFILYGDFKPYDVRAFVQRNNRWEEDGSRTDLGGILEAGGMVGEPEMTKCKLSRGVQPGVYMLEVLKGSSTYVRYPFRIE
jgi:hypothetical protein